MLITAGVSGAAYLDSLQLGPAVWLLTFAAMSFVIGAAISAIKAGYRPPAIRCRGEPGEKPVAFSKAAASQL